MQKDFHFNLTYALCTLVGNKDALKIAWANQFTDDCVHSKLYSLRTQSALLNDWYDKQVQFSVIIPFHFMPGDDPHRPWMVTRNNSRARSLVAQASNPFELGIALHCLQDTFSHENFSGWQEDLNACWLNMKACYPPWYRLRSITPNIGHAEMGVTPDVTNYVWTDPRTGKKIDNVARALSAAKATIDALGSLSSGWLSLEALLEPVFRQKDYDRRKQLLRELSGDSDLRFKDVNEDLEPKQRADFIAAANNHLSRATNLFEGLPREAP